MQAHVDDGDAGQHAAIRDLPYHAEWHGAHRYLCPGGRTNPYVGHDLAGSRERTADRHRGITHISDLDPEDHDRLGMAIDVRHLLGSNHKRGGSGHAGRTSDRGRFGLGEDFRSGDTPVGVFREYPSLGTHSTHHPLNLGGEPSTSPDMRRAMARTRPAPTTAMRN